MSFGRVVANLDFEESLAGNAPGPKRRMTARAERSARMLGTVLRVFATGSDRLWLPGGVGEGRVPSIPGIPSPMFETGSLRTLQPAEDWLAWGETEEIASLRARDLPRAHQGAVAEEIPLWARVWSYPRAIPPVARHVHQRSTHVKIADELGLDFPGRRVVSSLHELNNHLADGAARLSPTNEWILKPMFSAAGRHWIRGVGRAVERQSKLAAEKQFSEGRSMLFEPLLDRVRDLGVSFVITDEGPQWVGFHELEVSSAGKFRGVRIPVRESSEDPFPTKVRNASLRVAEKLHAVGYRGPAGVDAWQGKTRDGAVFDQLLGEINARLTFGWLAHAWRSRLAEVKAIEPDTPLDLRTSSEMGPPRSAIVLVEPGELDKLSAWIDTRGRESVLPY